MFFDDSDSEDYAGQVLPVSNFDSYDPSKPPEDGMDYLRRVQLEAAKYPDVMVASKGWELKLEKKAKLKKTTNNKSNNV